MTLLRENALASSSWTDEKESQDPLSGITPPRVSTLRTPMSTSRLPQDSISQAY